MNYQNIKRVHKDQKQYLTDNYYVSRIGIFGSYSREEQTELSDIDILVEFNRPVGFEFLYLKEYLEDLFDKPVDLVTITTPFLVTKC